MVGGLAAKALKSGKTSEEDRSWSAILPRPTAIAGVVSRGGLMLSYKSNTESRAIRMYCPTCVGDKDDCAGSEASSHWLLFNVVPFRQWRESTVKCSGCAGSFKTDLALDDVQSLGQAAADSLKKV